MRFDIFGRYELEVERRGDRWVVYRRGAGVRREDPDLVVPADVPEDALAGHLEDLLHEQGLPGTTVRRVDDVPSG